MKTKISILAFLIIIAFSSCKKDEPKPTTFQVKNNTSKIDVGFEYLDGSIYEVVVFCYKGNDIIDQKNIDEINFGGDISEVIVPASTTEKVKISFKLLPKRSPYYDLSSNSRKYTVQYFVIKQNENTIISIDDETMVSNSLESFVGLPFTKEAALINPYIY